MSARRVGRLILVGPDAVERPGQTVVYARVSSGDQCTDLDRQVARVTAWATGQGRAVERGHAHREPLVGVVHRGGRTRQRRAP